jgi:uncharacterized membrane protein YsdA (DUF1294 family)
MNYIPVLACILALAASYWLGYTPLVVAVIYIAFSLVTFLVYARDKAAALNGLWRVSEGTLHILSLLGGWPGAIVAQQRLRHKTKKTSFRILIWLTVIANAGVLASLHTCRGAIYLNTGLFRLEEIIVNEMSSGAVRTTLLNLLSFHA